ncbi:MAG: hypothetical protein MZW92_46060 [Comamonadaceae bacterium]|nr:hypothetical protein [Comamonadaceae bacterium]
MREANPAPTRPNCTTCRPVPVADRGRPVCSGHRRRRQQGDRAGSSPLAPTPQAHARPRRGPASPSYIQTIGLFRTKAKNVVATCRSRCSSSTAARCRASREALEALPGVGRKTANVVLNTAFGEPTIAVDTHIFRVANRTGLAPGKDRRTRSSRSC